MCSFNITENATKKTVTCRSAWDIFDTVIRITSDDVEASSSWKKAGHLDIGKSLDCSKYSIKRTA